MSLSGSATLAGTTHYQDRFQGKAAPGHFRTQQQLSLSSIGIGTYLGNADNDTDAKYVEAVTRSVQLGANVIDTAANYRFQRSERSIGLALQQLTPANSFERSEIVICTKGGYLPFDGAPPRDIRSYIEDTFIRPGIVKAEDIVGGSHCMTPSYLENQLDQSLQNMNIDTVDVYYIHNPESQLSAVSPEEFSARLRKAFQFLETARANNKIKKYGVATWNGFRVAATSKHFHSLNQMIAIAREVAGETHGFGFIQLPFNLGMLEALTVQNHQIDGHDVSVIEAAQALNVTVISSASIYQGRVASGLPESVREPLGSLRTDAQTAIQFVRSTPGITTALVGMSSPEHVEENLELISRSPCSTDDFLRLLESE